MLIYFLMSFENLKVIFVTHARRIVQGDCIFTMPCALHIYIMCMQCLRRAEM